MEPHVYVEIFHGSSVLISMIEDGETWEVVKWVHTEWEEDPSLCTTIANAVRLAYTNPGMLIAMNQEHIDSQKAIVRRGYF